MLKFCLQSVPKRGIISVKIFHQGIHIMYNIFSIINIFLYFIVNSASILYYGMVDSANVLTGWIVFMKDNILFIFFEVIIKYIKTAYIRERIINIIINIII